MTVITIDTVFTLLHDVTSPWDKLDIRALLQKQREHLGYPEKVFMTALRYALCGMKVCVYRILHSKQLMCDIHRMAHRLRISYAFWVGGGHCCDLGYDQEVSCMEKYRTVITLLIS
jgi:hypothetical protein